MVREGVRNGDSIEMVLFYGSAEHPLPEKSNLRFAAFLLIIPKLQFQAINETLARTA